MYDVSVVTKRNKIEYLSDENVYSGYGERFSWVTVRYLHGSQCRSKASIHWTWDTIKPYTSVLLYLTCNVDPSGIRHWLALHVLSFATVISRELSS